MKREAKLLLILAGLIVIGTGGALAALSWLSPPVETSRHTLFHIGCTHHNHGPAWHAGHAKSASFQRPLGGASVDTAPAPLERRALTAGR